MPVSRGAGLVALAAFFFLLAGLPVLRGVTGSSAVALFDAFYRSGALVFGGGHVVLPLLREAFVTPGWVSDDVFLAGYGAAQAVPGPLFTFAAYLGTVVAQEPHGPAGSVLGRVGPVGRGGEIFGPGGRGRQRAGRRGVAARARPRGRPGCVRARAGLGCRRSRDLCIALAGLGRPMGVGARAAKCVVGRWARPARWAATAEAERFWDDDAIQ